MAKVTTISKEELAPITAAYSKVLSLTQAADIALKDARIAELEFELTKQRLYTEKGLTSECRVNIETGIVEWPEEVVKSEIAPKRETAKRTSKKKASKKEPEVA